MKTILNKTTDPAFNLALEEYLLKEYTFDEDILLIWRNDKSVIIGRNQNPWNEVNILYTEENDIPIIRRSSGGGTVVHDLGNINFSFISNSTEHINDYEYFLTPIIRILNSIGLKARFEPKSHIYVGNKKISGNAQALYKGKMIHHGTLLYDSDLNRLSKCIKNEPVVEGHFVESNKAPICNIKSLLLVQSSIEEFMDFLRDELLLNDTNNKVITLTENDLEKINQIKTSKYLMYDWNFRNSFKFSNKLLNMTIQKGIITKSSLVNTVGLKLLPSELMNFLDKITISEIF